MKDYLFIFLLIISLIFSGCVLEPSKSVITPTILPPSEVSYQPTLHTTLQPSEESFQSASPTSTPAPVIINEKNLNLLRFTSEKHRFSIMIPSDYKYCTPKDGTAGDAGEVFTFYFAPAGECGAVRTTALGTSYTSGKCLGTDCIKIESVLYGDVNQWVWIRDKIRANSDSISVQDIEVKGTILKKIIANNYTERTLIPKKIVYATASPNEKGYNFAIYKSEESPINEEQFDQIIATFEYLESVS